MRTLRFLEAFARRDLGGLAALLAPDAEAELVGSGFEPERGPERIRAGALAHVLGPGDPSLVAEAGEDGTVLLVQGPGGPVEMVVAIQWTGDRIRRLRFHTLSHDRETVAQAATAAVRALAT